MYHYQHHIGDFNNATRHLSRLERSLYRDLLELYYDTESPLPDDVSWICRKIIANECSTDVERLLNEFFTKIPGGWYHDRCEHEIEKYRLSSSQKAIAGRASAAKRAVKIQQALNGRSTDVQRTLNGRSTDCQLTVNRKPRTVNRKPITKTNTTQPDGCESEFQEFYDSYPRKIDRHRAGKAFSKLNPDPELLRRIIAHCKKAYLGTEDRYIPSPTTYLNDRRWEDEHPESNVGFIKMHTDRSWRDVIDGPVANAEAQIERYPSVVATVVAGGAKQSVKASQEAT